MKKYFSMLVMAVMASMSFTACDTETDEEAGGTNIQRMCGYWDVIVDAVDESGNIIYEDPYGKGTCTVFTYNTASNGTTQMWLDDQDTFWAYKFLVDINYNALTFSATERDYDAAGSGTAVVTNGKILENAAKNLHGAPADSIVFDIKFSDDDNGLIYRVSGQRHSGFTE